MQRRHPPSVESSGCSAKTALTSGGGEVAGLAGPRLLEAAGMRHGQAQPCDSLRHPEGTAAWKRPIWCPAFSPLYSLRLDRPALAHGRIAQRHCARVAPQQHNVGFVYAAGRAHYTGQRKCRQTGNLGQDPAKQDESNAGRQASSCSRTQPSSRRTIHGRPKSTHWQR